MIVCIEYLRVVCRNRASNRDNKIEKKNNNNNNIHPHETQFVKLVVSKTDSEFTALVNKPTSLSIHVTLNTQVII